MVLVNGIIVSDRTGLKESPETERAKKKEWDCLAIIQKCPVDGSFVFVAERYDERSCF